MSLDQELTDALGDAAVLRRHGSVAVADALEDLAGRVRHAAREYLTWVSETDAVIRSDHRVPYWRARFADLEARDLARWNPKNRRERQYRLLIVPLRVNLPAVRADARRTAQAERESA